MVDTLIILIAWVRKLRQNGLTSFVNITELVSG